VEVAYGRYFMLELRFRYLMHTCCYVSFAGLGLGLVLERAGLGLGLSLGTVGLGVGLGLVTAGLYYNTA